MKKVILGLGEEFKADDGVGCYVIKELRARKSKHMLLYFDVPENAFTALRKSKTRTLIIVDAADFSGKPGQIKIVTEIKEKEQLSTHSTSISKVIKYVKESIGIKDVTLIFIQPKSLEFGKEMSPEVRQAGDIVVDLLS